jgi:hypothetical protein
MARESNLWKNLRAAQQGLRAMGHKCVLTRIENAVGVGHPDVEGCITPREHAQGQQVWIELKAVPRPAKPTTPARPKLRPAQEIWHRERAAAGFRQSWVLMQVGEGIHAGLYLIPGVDYKALCSTESDLSAMSFCLPTDDLCTVLLKAHRGW